MGAGFPMTTATKTLAPPSPKEVMATVIAHDLEDGDWVEVGANLPVPRAGGDRDLQCDGAEQAVAPGDDDARSPGARRPGRLRVRPRLRARRAGPACPARSAQ